MCLLLLLLFVAMDVPPVMLTAALLVLLPPCLLAALQAARMIRPVKQIASGAAEMIGGLEQNNMSIRVPDGGVGGTKGLRFTHEGGWVGGWVQVEVVPPLPACCPARFIHFNLGQLGLSRP